MKLLVPLEDYHRAAQYQERRGICLGLGILGVVAYAAACLLWPHRKNGGVRLVQVTPIGGGGSGGGGPEIPRPDSDAPEAPEAEALPN